MKLPSHFIVREKCITVANNHRLDNDDLYFGGL